eukprot:TRINITY_DN16253_c1_g1_i4.p1 TRINITY_DN16253_c1_g1~~TRINITY_DN16253_c1_g1_i4.p1  ORF type:complete len:268 (+),score=-22.57 TRINITY_DN16253_c1_g1_i4:850-1653(+)
MLVKANEQLINAFVKFVQDTKVQQSNQIQQKILMLFFSSTQIIQQQQSHSVTLITTTIVLLEAISRSSCLSTIQIVQKSYTIKQLPYSFQTIVPNERMDERMHAIMYHKQQYFKILQVISQAHIIYKQIIHTSNLQFILCTIVVYGQMTRYVAKCTFSTSCIYNFFSKCQTYQTSLFAQTSSNSLILFYVLQQHHFTLDKPGTYNSKQALPYACTYMLCCLCYSYAYKMELPCDIQTYQFLLNLQSILPPTLCKSQFILDELMNSNL